MLNGLLLAGLKGRVRATSRMEVVEAVCVKLRFTGIDDCLGGTIPGDGPPSPSLTKASIVFSIFPLTPFSTRRFLWSSVKPISRSLASFLSVSWLSPLSTLAPNS